MPPTGHLSTPHRPSEAAIRTRTRTAALLLVAALVVAGCGGDDGDDTAADETSTSTTTAPAAESRTTAPAGPDDGAPVASTGCEGGQTGQVEKERHELPLTDPAGSPRYYLLTAPESTEPVPLVVDFHGLSEGAQVHSVMSAMGEYGLEQGFATAFPHGTGSPISWKVGDGSADPAYVEALLDEIAATRCIDTSRVYATGLSNGAMMTSRMACTMADRFAAFAPVAGLTMYEGCDPGRPIPILTFHGTADPILLFNGGVGDLGIISGEQPAETSVPEADLDGEGYPETARQWAELLECDPEPAEEERTDEILVRTWTCPEGAALEFVIVRGGGHSWPGSEFSQTIEDIVGPTTTDIDANEAMWEFFQRYAL